MQHDYPQFRQNAENKVAYDIGRKAFANTLPDATFPIPAESRRDADCLWARDHIVTNKADPRPLILWERLAFRYLTNADLVAKRMVANGLWPADLLRHHREYTLHLPSAGDLFDWRLGFYAAAIEYIQNGRLLNWSCYESPAKHNAAKQIDGQED